MSRKTNYKKRKKKVKTKRKYSKIKHKQRKYRRKTKNKSLSRKKKNVKGGHERGNDKLTQLSNKYMEYLFHHYNERNEYENLVEPARRDALEQYMADIEREKKNLKLFWELTTPAQTAETAAETAAAGADEERVIEAGIRAAVDSFVQSGQLTQIEADRAVASSQTVASAEQALAAAAAAADKSRRYVAKIDTVFEHLKPSLAEREREREEARHRGAPLPPAAFSHIKLSPVRVRELFESLEAAAAGGSLKKTKGQKKN